MDPALTRVFVDALFATADARVMEPLDNGKRRVPPELEAPAIRTEMERLLDSIRFSEYYNLLLLKRAVYNGDGMTVVGLIEHIKSEGGRQEAIRAICRTPHREKIISDGKGRSFYLAIVKNILVRWDPMSETLKNMLAEWVMDWRDPEVAQEVSLYLSGRSAQAAPPVVKFPAAPRAKETRSMK